MNTKFTNARVLVPGEGHNFNIIEGEVWVQGNTITYVGDGSDVTADVAGNEGISWDRTIDCEKNLLMPGFKNAHTHTAMTFLRSYADDLPLSNWLNDAIFPKEALLTGDDVYWLSLLGIMEYLTSGITANFDMYMFTQQIAKASVDAGFRTAFCGCLNNFSQTLESTEEDYLAINEMSDLTSYFIGFHAEYTTSLELMEGIAKLSQKYHSPTWVHNSETKSEVEGCIERYGKTPTELLDSIGAYEYGGGSYHAVWVRDNDFEIMKKKGIYASTNPSSNLKLASGIAPIQRYIDEGIGLCIGTDGPASNNALDMFREMYLVSALGKVREDNAAAVPAEEVLYAAVAGGAKAMGLEDSDSIAVGKKADLILIDLQQPNMQPENAIVKNLVYSGSKQNVKMTMVDGKVLYEDNGFNIGFDPKEIYAKANAVINRMR